MTRHTGAVEIERPVSPAEAAPILREAADAAGAQAAPALRTNRRAWLLGAASAAVLALGAWYGTQYWTVGRFEVSTDDAYVQADNTTIAPR
ncbi:MAG: HlyD family secretion protein, partial [Bradyrhizobium sp.]